MGGRLIRNAVALIASGGGTAILGVVFWSIAAHRATPANLGRNSAEIAIMILIASLSQLGFGSTFERFLPIAGNRTRQFVVRAYVVCFLIALVLAMGYVSLGLANRVVPTSFGWRALFIVVTAMWVVFALQDSVLVGLRESRWVPVENVLYSLAKLALIPVALTLSSSQGVFLAWTSPVIVVIVVVNWYLFKKRIPEHQARNVSSEALPSRRELTLLTGSQFATLLLNVISPAIVTLIVIQRLGPVASAHYYLPSQIASGASILIGSINRSFLVEASSESEALRDHARVALRAGLVVLIASVVLGGIFAPLILSLFGTTYAASGSTLLRLLFLALPGYTIATFYSSFALLDKRVWWMVVRDVFSTGVYFGTLFVFIGRFGILAMGIASLTEAGLLGVFFLPMLVRRYRATSSS